jgi:hypothetical protein
VAGSRKNRRKENEVSPSPRGARKFGRPVSRARDEAATAHETGHAQRQSPRAQMNAGPKRNRQPGVAGNDEG